MTNETPSTGERLSFSHDIAKTREQLRTAISFIVRDDDQRIWKEQRVKALTLCLAIFLVAGGVRILHWQDSHSQILWSKTSLMGVFDRYKKEARRMIEERSILFPQEQPEQGNARILVHPPGYAMMVAAIYAVSDHALGAIWAIQIACDAIAAVLIFLITLELFTVPLAFTSGMLVALSPQLAYYSLVLSPDSLAVLPILISIYLIVLAMKNPRLMYVLAAGALIGTSCWLRANALALAPFLALAIPILFPPGKRLRNSMAFVAAAIVIVAPITLRNFIVFHRFIPISIAAGLNLSEGIGNFDKEGKLGMPRSDREARFKDAEWAGRPDYAHSLWVPDGIDRDQERTSRALGVIRQRPLWFLGAMLRRAAFMLRYNDSKSYGWPFDTSVVPRVSVEPPFSNAYMPDPEGNIESSDPNSVLVVNGQLMDTPMQVPGDRPVVWASPAADLAASGQVLSAASQVLLDDGAALVIAGDDTDWGDQFASMPFSVEQNEDYVLLIDADRCDGPIIIRITDPDMKRSVSTVNATQAMLAGRDNQITPGLDSSGQSDAARRDPIEIQVPFATGRLTQIRLVFSNGGPGSRPAAIRVRAAKLVAAGPTRGALTRYPRFVISGLQSLLFNTWRMVALILAGTSLLALSGRFKALVAVLVVPAYYLGAQSVLSTEYRYILGIHYFVPIAAAITLNTAGWLCYRGLMRLRTYARRPKAATSLHL